MKTATGTPLERDTHPHCCCCLGWSAHEYGLRFTTYINNWNIYCLYTWTANACADAYRPRMLGDAKVARRRGQQIFPPNLRRLLHIFYEMNRSSALGGTPFTAKGERRGFGASL